MFFLILNKKLAFYIYIIIDFLNIIWYNLQVIGSVLVGNFVCYDMFCYDIEFHIHKERYFFDNIEKYI